MLDPEVSDVDIEGLYFDSIIRPFHPYGASEPDTLLLSALRAGVLLRPVTFECAFPAAQSFD